MTTKATLVGEGESSPEPDGSEFRLPVVAGRRSDMSNAAFERACLVHIERLQDGIGPYDSAMMATFCEAVRMVREYSDAMQARIPNSVVGAVCADCLDWRTSRCGYCMSDPAHDHEATHGACSQFRRTNAPTQISVVGSSHTEEKRLSTMKGEGGGN